MTCDKRSFHSAMILKGPKILQLLVTLKEVCSLQLTFHITLLPRSYLFRILQNLKASSCFFLLRSCKPARKRPLRRRKQLFSFGDSMTKQHDLAEIEKKCTCRNSQLLNYKLGQWKKSERGQSLKLLLPITT